MGRGYQKAAFFTRYIQISKHLGAHLLRRAKGHRRLRPDRSVEGDPVAVFVMDLFKIHTFGLHRI